MKEIGPGRGARVPSDPPMFYHLIISHILHMMVLKQTHSVVRKYWQVKREDSHFVGTHWKESDTDKNLCFSHDEWNPLTPMSNKHLFQSMPMLIYVGAVMGILYYLGITQVVASKLGWLVQVTMGTTAIESLSVAGNIFLNGVTIFRCMSNVKCFFGALMSKIAHWMSIWNI